MRVRGLCLLLFLSGIAALGLEVAWFRRTAQVAGATSLALGAVLLAVIGGMALGAFLFGRATDRLPRPLRFYAALESGVALLGFCSPWLLDSSAPLHAAVYRALAGSPALLGAARFGLSSLVLMPPALLLGGTLPAAVAALRSPASRRGRGVGLLYAFNTLGGVVGTLLAGFVLLPALGLAASMRVAACFSAAAAVGAVLLARRAGAPLMWPPTPEEAAAEEPPRFDEKAGRKALTLASASGALGLAAEVAFTRSLVLVFGSTTYAFSVMLATFLAGIGAGGALGAWLSRRVARPQRALALSVGATAALFSLGALAVYALPRLYLEGYVHGGSGFGVGLALRFALSALVLLPGALGLGVTFPLAAHIAAEREPGAGTGRLYALNTVASVAGSTLAVFALVPALGPQGTVALMATAAALVAALSSRRLLSFALLAVAALGFWPPSAVARERLLAGIYFTPGAYMKDGAIDEEAWQDGVDLPFYAYGRESTVCLDRWYGKLTLLIDGKGVAGNQAVTDVRHLELLGHLPMAISPHPKRVLVVGLGFGTTFRAVSLWRPQSVTVVELEPEVVVAERRIGAAPQHVVIADARTYLDAGSAPFDVITSDPIHPWVRGAGDLYTKEYFEACRKRLAPGGIACQWLPLYQMSLEDIQSVLKTFCSVFPASAAYFAGRDLVLIGTNAQTLPEPHATEGAVKSALFEIGAFHLGSLKLAGGARLKEAASGGEVLHDDGLKLEFSAPRQVDNPEMGAVLEWVERLWKDGPPAYKALLRADAAWISGDGKVWSEQVERALDLAPHDAFVRRYVGERDLDAADSQIRSGSPKNAKAYLDEAARFLKDDARVTGLRADMLAALGDRKGAAHLYEQILQQEPNNTYARRRLARVRVP